jgi:hypothetical protein
MVLVRPDYCLSVLMDYILGVHWPLVSSFAHGGATRRTFLAELLGE